MEKITYKVEISYEGKYETTVSGIDLSKEDAENKACEKLEYDIDTDFNFIEIDRCFVTKREHIPDPNQMEIEYNALV